MNKEIEVQKMLNYISNYSFRITKISDTIYKSCGILFVRTPEAARRGSIDTTIDFTNKKIDWSAFSFYHTTNIIYGKIIEETDWNDFIYDAYNMLKEELYKQVAKRIDIEEEERQKAARECKISQRINSILKKD